MRGNANRYRRSGGFPFLGRLITHFTPLFTKQRPTPTLKTVGTAGTTTGATTASVTTTAGVGQILCVATTPGSGVSINYTIAGWTLVLRVNYNAGDLERNVAIWTKAGTGASESATITPPGGATYAEITWSWTEWANLAEVRQATSATGNSSAPSVALGAFTDVRNATIEAIGSASSLNPVRGVEFEQLHEQAGAVQGDILHVAYREDNDKTVDASSSTGSDFWGIIGAELVYGTWPSSGVTGTGAVTFDAMTVAGTGALPIRGTASVTLGAMTVAGTGQLAIKGTGAATFGDMTVAGTGQLAIKGTGAATFGDMTVAGTGQLAIKGTGAATFDDLTVAGTGTLTSGITGTAAITFGDMTVAGTGQLALQGSAAITLAAMTMAGTGQLAIKGTGTATFGDMTVAGTGQLAIRATGAVAFGDMTVAGTGTSPRVATGSVTFDDMTAAGQGNLPLIGTLSVTLDDMTVSGAGNGPGGGGPVERAVAHSPIVKVGALLAG